MHGSRLRRLLAPLALAVPFALAAFASTDAQAASLAACGNIHIEANAECEMELEGGCEALCQPLNFTASCSADLHATCEGQCEPLEIEAGCEASCQGSCEASCEADPGSFECEGYCNAECGASCEARCEAEAEPGMARAECEASCTASCDVECRGSCEATPPSADCQAQCQGSCEGECYAEVRGGCQIDCQASGYAECYADLQGGCEVECQSPDGALVCDGQYVDHGGNLDECVDALVETFNIMVEGYARGECSGNMCSGEAGGSISCSVAEDNDAGKNGALALVLGLGLLGLRRRRD